MKTIYNKQNKNFFIAGLALVLVASLGFFVQSCSQEDLISNVDNSSDVQYLDLDVTSNVAFTKTQLDLMAHAAQRITDNLVFDKENNKYVYALKSAAEINVSERLFNYIYSGMSMYTKDIILRLKDDIESFTIWGMQYYQTQYNLTNQQTLQLIQNMNDFYASSAVVGGLAGLAQWFKGTPYTGMVLTIGGLLSFAKKS